MTTMPPRGAPLGSARHPPSSKPSLAFKTIRSPMFRLRVVKISIPDARSRECKITKDLPAGGVRPRRPFGDPDAGANEDEGDGVIERESFAEQDDREQGAEHRHEVDEDAG